MTLNLNVQSLSYTSSRLQVAFGSPAAVNPDVTPTTRSARGDRATLSSTALAAASDGANGRVATPSGIADAPAPEPAPTGTTTYAPTPTSRAAARAQALFTALDADNDGTVTKDEFTSGAKALLGRDRGPRLSDDDENDENDDRRVARFERRLDRKLDRTFDRVDGDDNGGISVEELTATFEKIGRGRRGGRPDGPPPSDAPPSADAPPAAQASGGGANVASITIQFAYVSIAIQRYAAVQGPAAAEPSSPRQARVDGDASDDATSGGTERSDIQWPAPSDRVTSPGLVAA